MEILYAIGALASSVAAVLAWIAKVKWSKEFSDAKNATISAKDAVIAAKESEIKALSTQLEHLNELTPMKIREYFSSVKTQLEEYNDLLQKKLTDARTEVENKKKQIESLSTAGEQQAGQLQSLETERSKLEEKATQLEKQVEEFKRQSQGGDSIIVKIPKIDPNIFANISDYSFVTDIPIISSATYMNNLSSTLHQQFANIRSALSTDIKLSDAGNVTIVEKPQKADSIDKDEADNKEGSK